MPIVSVENVGKLSDKQKQLLIERITQIVVEVTGKAAESVYIRIDEIPGTNFGVGGKPLS